MINEERLLARRLLGREDNTEFPEVVRTTGTISQINDDGTVSVKIRGSDTAVPNVERDANYLPSAGDNVHIEISDGHTRVTGKSGNSPTVFAGAQSSTISTSETRATNTYGDLATIGPYVTVVVGSSGMLLVGISSKLTPASGSDGAVMSFLVTGANSLAASDAWCVALDQVSGSVSAGRQTLLTGLTPGSTSVVAQYRSTNGAAAAFANRALWALPM